MHKLLVESPVRDLEVAFGRLLVQAEQNGLRGPELQELRAGYIRAAARARQSIEQFPSKDDLWTHAPRRNVHELRSEGSVGRFAKVRVRIDKISERAPRLAMDISRPEASPEYFDLVAADLRDAEGEATIASIPIARPETADRLYELSQRYGRVDILGLPILARTGAEPDYFVWLMEIRAPDSPLQILRASPEEVVAARRVLDRLAADGISPVDWLRSEVVELIRLRGLGTATDLSEGLDVVVLQALSHGRIENASGRIHTAVIGPPATGKKLLTEAAQLLNPAFQQSGHKLSLAGLVGAAVKSNRGYATQPGLLALAHRGTLALEDFHRLTGRNAGQVLPVLLQAMEDGCVSDSTASMSCLEANTALHVDLNRARDVELGSAKDGPGLSNLSMELISRLDVIIEVEGDPGTQFDVARERAAEIAEVGRAALDYSSNRARLLKVVVAVLREELPDIRVPSDQRLRVQAFLQQLEDEYEQGALDLLGRCVNRMVNSICKIAAASARGNRRDFVSDEDLEVAFHLMRLKADFLRTLAAEIQAEGRAHMGKKARRQADVVSELRGQVIDLDEYRETANELGYAISQATGYRDVADLEKIEMIVRRHGEIQVLGSAEEAWQEGTVAAE